MKIQYSVSATPREYMTLKQISFIKNDNSTLIESLQTTTLCFRDLVREVRPTCFMFPLCEAKLFSISCEELRMMTGRKKAEVKKRLKFKKNIKISLKVVLLHSVYIHIKVVHKRSSFKRDLSKLSQNFSKFSKFSITATAADL